MSDVADILDRTADALWMYGRNRGAGLGLDGQTMCVLGAMRYVQGLDPADWVTWRGPGHEELRAFIASHPECCESPQQWEHVGVRLDGSPFLWNDNVEDDSLVIDTLRRCAKQVREDAS